MAQKKKEQKTTWWHEMFNKHRGDLEDALAKRRPFEQWLTTAYSWVATMQDLPWASVTQANVVKAFKAAAINGLLVDGNECMVMIRGKAKPKVQCEICAQGVIRQAGDAGIYINSRAIKDGDKIEIDEGAGTVHHSPAWLVNSAVDDAATIGFYAVATFRDGRQVVRSMSLAEATKRSRDTDAWKSWSDEMGCKSAILTLRKVLYFGDEIEGLIQSSGIKPDDTWAREEAHQEAAEEPTHPPQTTRDKVMAAASRAEQDAAAEAAQEEGAEPETLPTSAGPI